MHLERHAPLVAAILIGATVAVWASAPLDALIVFTCVLLSAVIALLLKFLYEPREGHGFDSLQLLLDLSHDKALADIHSHLSESLKSISTRVDPVFRGLTLARLEMIAKDLRRLGDGVVEFVSTESWRVAYEELLRSPGLHLYRSIAHIESAHYWQDGPGKQSTRLNLHLHDEGILSIERIAIIADHLWPDTDRFPVEPIHSWLDQQHRHGIWIRLLRESELGSDTDLICDLGIYGSRGVGFQVSDPSGRTMRFRIDFNYETVAQAEQTWNRLIVYAISYADLLDQREGSS